MATTIVLQLGNLSALGTSVLLPKINLQLAIGRVRHYGRDLEVLLNHLQNPVRASIEASRL
jgi:hypothetical protein